LRVDTECNRERALSRALILRQRGIDDAAAGGEFVKRHLQFAPAFQGQEALGRRLLHLKHRNGLNTRALERIQSSMPEENKKNFKLFCRSRRSRLLPRMYWLLQSGIYREPKLENLHLILAALVGKI
jgi:hypothetical protein